MQHVHRHGILGPKGLLTPGSVLSAILIGGIVVLLASQSAYTQVGQEANKVLVGAAAFGDWHNDAPGVRRLITAQDLPEIGKEEPSIAEVVPMPVGARPRVPEGFSAELVASGLAQPRAIRAAPNGDLFVANSSENEVRVYRIPSGSSKPTISEVFVAGLHQPYGIAFDPQGPDPQWIYIANSSSVVRFPYKNGDLKTTAKPEGIVECIPATHHWTRDILFTPDGKRLLLTIASGSNAALDMFPWPLVPGGIWLAM
jgi:glucose/arabinose dehydrogenase